MKTPKIKIGNKKSISFIAVFLIILGIITTTLLVINRGSFLIKAGPSSTPKDIQVTNISDSAFTLTYSTDESVIGTISFGEDQNILDQTALDDKDQLSQKLNNYKSHSITANNLKPDTTYYFTITSGSDTINNNGQPFSIKTGMAITDPPNSQIPVSGRVINPDGTSPKDGLVFLTIPGAAKLSTLIKDNGTYILPINTLRNDALDGYFRISDDSKIELKIISDNLISVINIKANQLSPVPVVTLSNNYDFSENPEEPIPTRSASFGDLEFPTDNPTTTN
jgi:hypothetical protein